MADVQITQTPDTSSGSGWVWGIVVLVLLAIIGWFIFGGGLHRTTTARIDINAPGAPAGGGTAGGTVRSRRRWDRRVAAAVILGVPELQNTELQNC